VDYMTNNPGVRPYQKNASLSNKKAEENLGIKMRTIDEALLEVKKQLNL